MRSPVRDHGSADPANEGMTAAKRSAQKPDEHLPHAAKDTRITATSTAATYSPAGTVQLTMSSS